MKMILQKRSHQSFLEYFIITQPLLGTFHYHATSENARLMGQYQLLCSVLCYFIVWSILKNPIYWVNVQRLGKIIIGAWTMNGSERNDKLLNDNVNVNVKNNWTMNGTER